MALNMRNSSFQGNSMPNLCKAISNSAIYITGLSLKFCFLDIYDIQHLAEAMRFNKTIVKLDLSKNALKSCMTRFLLDGLQDNYCLAHLDLSGNFLDNEFAADLGHLLEDN